MIEEGTQEEFRCVGAFNPSGIYPARCIPLFENVGLGSEGPIFVQKISKDSKISGFWELPETTLDQFAEQGFFASSRNSSISIGAGFMRAYSLGSGDNYIREDGEFGLAFLDAMVRAPHCYRNPIAAAAIARELLSSIPDFVRDPSLREHVQNFEVATYLIDNAASFLTSGEATEEEFDLLSGHLIIGLDGEWSRSDLEYFWACIAQLDGQIVGTPVVSPMLGASPGRKRSGMNGIILKKAGNELSFIGPGLGKLRDTMLPAPRRAKPKSLYVPKYLQDDDYTWYTDEDRRTWSEGTLGASLLTGAIEQRMTGLLWSFFEHRAKLDMHYLPRVLSFLLCRVHPKRELS